MKKKDIEQLLLGVLLLSPIIILPVLLRRPPIKDWLLAFLFNAECWMIYAAKYIFIRLGRDLAEDYKLSLFPHFGLNALPLFSFAIFGLAL